MSKKIFAVIFIMTAILTVFPGCGLTGDHQTICKKWPFKREIRGGNVQVSLTIYLFHNDEGFVTKSEMVEEYLLLNGNINSLKTYASSADETFKNEIFQVQDFEYSSKLKDRSFTITTTYDYTKMDIKEELDDGKEFYHVKGLIDENYMIPYDKVIEAYTELGFVCEAVS